MRNHKDRWERLVEQCVCIQWSWNSMSNFMERGLEEVDCKYNQIESSDLPGIDMECDMKMLCSGRPAFHFCCMN